MSANESKTKSLLIRRFIAVFISIAAVLCLFLPMLSISEDAQAAFRRAKTENSESNEAFIADLPGTVARLLKDEDVKKQHIRTVEDIASDLVYNVAMPLYRLGEDHRITLLEACQIVGLPAKAVDILDAHEDELDDCLKDFGESDPEYKEQEAEIRHALSNLGPVASFSRIGSYVLYGLAGATLLLGILSIITELLNRSKSTSVLFCVFAILLAALFILTIVGPRLMDAEIKPFRFDLEAEDVGEALTKLANAAVKAVTTLLPGIGLILLPLCAFVPCVLYKRDKSYDGVFPKRSRKAAASKKTERLKQKAMPPKKMPVAVPPAPGKFWTCSACGQQNGVDSRFCCACGAQKPQRKPAPADSLPVARYCPVCGRELSAHHLFCPGCGAKVQPKQE